MRKITLILLSAVFTLLLLSASATDAPVVTLRISGNTLSGGLPAAITLWANQPAAADTSIRFTDSNGTEYTAVLPAGQAETTATVPTPVVKKRTIYTFTLSDGEGYTAGTGGEITLYPLPKVEFYQPIYVRKAGNDCLITVTLTKNNLPDDAVFELRDQTGAILAARTMKKDLKPGQFHFEWTPDAAQKGRHDLSVWYEGLKISADDGYLALTGGEPLIVTHYDVTEKFIALSLDCAYQWEYIDDFLEMLDRQAVKVTFFMTGFGVEAQPEAVLRIQAHGHELGNHSYWHHHLDQIDDLLTIRREIRSVNDLIETLAGVRPTKFRAPYGGYDKYVSAISRAEGCEVIQWTNDARDWVEGATEDSIYRNIIRNAAPGNIILAHILNKDTVAALDRAITYFKEQGYRLGTVSELEAIYQSETGKDHEP